MALPVLNLQKAQAAGLPVMTACASCYARLRTANHKVRNEPEERQRAERITGKPYDGSVEVHHVLDVLVNHFGVDAIRARVSRPLSGLRVACYYGCLLTRPPEVVAFDDPEHPHAMDDLVAATGAEPVDWPYEDRVLRGEPFDDATPASWPAGPPAALDGPTGRGRVHRRRLPVVPGESRSAPGRRAQGPRRLCRKRRSCTSRRLLGLALGLSAEELGLTALTVSAESLLSERGIGREAVLAGRAYPAKGEES